MRSTIVSLTGGVRCRGATLSKIHLTSTPKDYIFYIIFEPSLQNTEK